MPVPISIGSQLPCHVSWYALLALGMANAGFLCRARTENVVLRLLLGFGWSHTGLLVWGAAGEKGEEVVSGEKEHKLELL